MKFTTPVLNADASGVPIVNPLNADHDYRKSGGVNYSLGGCFIWVPHDFTAHEDSSLLTCPIQHLEN